MLIKTGSDMPLTKVTGGIFRRSGIFRVRNRFVCYGMIETGI